MGGYLQWVPLTNLWCVSIFHELDLSTTFKNLGTRAGYLAMATMSVNVICWLVCYGITYGMYKSTWESMDSSAIGFSIWNMSAISWLPF